MKIISKKTDFWKKAVKGALVLLVLISLIFYKDSFREIWEGIRQVKAGELLVCLLLAGTGYLLEGMTIFRMMGAVIPSPSLWEGVFIAYVCEFYRLTTMGNGSGVAEIHYLCKSGMRKKKGSPIAEAKGGQEWPQGEKIAPGSATVLTMIQYIMKRIAIMGLGLLSFLILCQKENTRELCREYGVFVSAGCVISAGVIGIFLALSLWERVAAAILRALEWLSGKIPAKESVFQKWREQIMLLNHSGKAILGQKKRMLCAVLIQMGKLLLFYGIIAYLLKGATEMGAGMCILLMALAFMLSGVIPAPSGAGALEFVFLLFFSRFVNTGTAVTAMLVYRFATWIFPAAVGGVFLAADRRRRGKGTGKMPRSKTPPQADGASNL